MITGLLKNWRAVPGLEEHPIWREAFEWIENNAADAEEGITELGEDGYLVRVMSYPLKPRDEAKFESHLRTIDLQFTIKGAEAIEWQPVGDLTAKGEYLAEKDFQFYENPAHAAGRVDNLEGNFCILYPSDGHMPQCEVPGYSEVTKLVVKIPTRLVGAE